MTNDEEQLEALIQGSRKITADSVRTEPTSALLSYWSNVTSAVVAIDEQGFTEQRLLEQAPPPFRAMWEEIRRAAALVRGEIDRRIPPCDPREGL